LSHLEFVSALLDAEQTLPKEILSLEGSIVSERFNVYRNNVMVSLIAIIEERYPVVQALVGHDFFRFMARAFVLDHPPLSPVMHEYGEAFSTFIAHFTPVASIPYLSDMAKLEWSRTHALHASDAPSFSANELIPLLADPGRLARVKLTFQPSVVILRSNFAIASLWLAHQHELESDIRSALAEINPYQAEAVLLVRQDWFVSIHLLNVGEAFFVLALEEGETLQNSLERAQGEDQSFDLASIMVRLLELGVFTGSALPGDLQTSPL
jgi:hypothetical protein